MSNDGPVITVARSMPRPEAGVVEAFRGAPIGNVSDANGRQGALDHRLKPVTRAAAFCGPVLTVDAGAHDNLAVWLALEHIRPGDVVVIATGDYEGAATVGDLLVGFMAKRGAAAVVTDGLVRDLEGLEKLGVPVVARGVRADGPDKLGPGSVGLPVRIAGRRVETGDVAVGDRDGVVVVPGVKAAAAVKALEGVRAKEAATEAALEAGADSPDWLAATVAATRIAVVD